MGLANGFIKFTRELPAKRPPHERLNDYNEFVNKFTDEKLNQQAARCMDCGVPFCHNGCPLGNNIPDFNDAVYRGNWLEAYQILSATNNFPEFTGRICPAPCESACVLGINAPAITIEEIEKHIIEIAFENGYVKPQIPNLRSGKMIAIIGSGPAGLACATQLNYAGHTVTIFEKSNLAGGLLRYGIPDFKLEKWVLDRRLKLMEEEGVIFKCNTHIGEDIKINDLTAKFDAIVLCGGSEIPRDLNIPGRELKGVHFAMDFLTQQNKRNTGQSFNDIEITAYGKDVVVIGGGDTGSDCVGTSNRQKAATITQFEVLPKPPESRPAHQPWPTYPFIIKTTSSHEEGVQRHWAIATKEFIGDEHGNLKALKIIDLEWKYKAAHQVEGFVEILGTESVIPCQLALLAMGFMHPNTEKLLQQIDLQLDERKNILANDRNFHTNIPKIFSAGDMRRGQSLVVWAISEGRECAKAVDTFLMDNSFLESKDKSIYHQYS